MIISQEFSKITHESKTYKKYSFLYVTTATQHRDSFRTTAVRHWGWSILSLSFRDATWQRLSSMEDQSFIMMANRFCVVVVVVSRSKTQTLDAWKCNHPELGRELIKSEASVHGKAKNRVRMKLSDGKQWSRAQWTTLWGDSTPPFCLGSKHYTSEISGGQYPTRLSKL